MNSSIFISFIYISFSFIAINGCGGGAETGKEIANPPQEIVNPPQETKELLVVSHTPLVSQIDVTENATIEVNFSHSTDENNVSIVVERQDNNEVIDGSIAFSSSGFIFSPTKSLFKDITYSVTVNYNALPNNPKVYMWSFSTVRTDLPEDRGAGSFHPTIKTQGNTSFSIVPIESVKAQELTKVSFGIPFPKGYLNNIKQFKIFDENNDEVEIAAQEVLPWRYINDDKTSIRSALVQVELVFSANEFGLLKPRELTLEWGVTRTTSDLPIESARASWILVDDQEFPASDEIYEPLAYALFSPSWYGDSVIKTRLLPLNTHSEFSAYDTAFELFGDTAINHVDPRVIDDNLIPHRESYAAWLFDRAMTIYQLAFRTGKFEYIRAAHRASQFYLQHINEHGYFSLKTSNDMKYSYGESLVAEYILFGDERIPDTIEKMIPAWDQFNVQYTLNTNFWTERHAAFQLLGYVTAYELLGDQVIKGKANATYTALRNMQLSPDEGVPMTGALMHTSGSHAEGGANFIASPWMSALLLDAVERYYIHFEEPSVADFSIRMANYFRQSDISMYEWKGYQGKDDYYMPHYLAGEGLTAKEHGGGSSDLEHIPDVTKIFSLAYFFSCAAGDCQSENLKTLAKLSNSQSRYTFLKWMRTSAPEVGLAAYRLAPPRKFNWWFRTTANNDFLLGDDTQLPIFREQAPSLELSQLYSGPKYYKPGDELTFTFALKNTGTSIAKNVVIFSNILKYSPHSLLEIVEVEASGINRGDSAIWKFESIQPGESFSKLHFVVRVKDLPALQSELRPIGDIVSFADLHFCAEQDTELTCQKWTNTHGIGLQTYNTPSVWATIAVKPPTSPPDITIISPLDQSIEAGQLDVIAEVADHDGVAKVEFWLEGLLLSEHTEAPFTSLIQTDTLASRDYRLTVKAWDIFGSAAEKSISFTPRNPDNIAPKIDILSPSVNGQYCEKLNVNYQVSDNQQIASCAIVLDGVSFSRPHCQPYQIYSPTSLFNAVALLDFDDEATTSVSLDGNSLKGKTTNVSFITGVYDQSAFFDGESSSVEFSSSALNIENDITVSFWLSPNADEGVIMSQDWYYVGSERGWAISLGPNNHEANNALSITWSSGNNSQNLNNRNVVQTAANSISLTKWQHVVVHKKNKQVNIYINGQLSASKELADENIRWPYNSERLFSIAKPTNHSTLYQKYYHGALDRLAIWNGALSERELTGLLSNVQDNSTHDLLIYATDIAGNRGVASASFSMICN